MVSGTLRSSTLGKKELQRVRFCGEKPLMASVRSRKVIAGFSEQMEISFSPLQARGDAHLAPLARAALPGLAFSA